MLLGFALSSAVFTSPDPCPFLKKKRKKKKRTFARLLSLESIYPSDLELFACNMLL